MKQPLRTYLPLAGITALGATLRFLQIGAEGLWIDEAFSVWLGQRPLAEMVRWVATVDQHPPLYYTLLSGWIRVLGDGEASARSLSALLSTLTLPVAYLLGRRVGDARVGLLCAVILAVSPFHVRFGQEARMYALMTLSGSLGLYAAMELLGNGGRMSGNSGDRTGSTLPWIGYVVCAATMLWTHNAAVLFPIALNLVVLGRDLAERRRCPRSTLPSRGRARWPRAWFLAQASVFVLWLPWLPTFVSQAAGVYRRFWIPPPTLATVLGVISEFLCGFLPLSSAGVVVVNVALAAVAILGVRRLRHRPGVNALLLTMFLVPILGECIVSVWRPILYARTLIWASIPLYLMLASGLSAIEVELSSRAGVLVALGFVAAANGLGLCGYYHNFEKEAWDDAAALVAGYVRADDLLLFNDAWGQIPFDYYFERLYNREVVEHGLPVDLFDRGVLEPVMTARDLPRMRALTDGRARVWLVTSHAWYTDPERLIPRALEEDLSILDRWAFHGVRVTLYGRGDG
ncbi:MAG: glycosyltransferase family 39 protein [Anaerolineae bacterium]|jgi:uncharacterized membrane protein